MFIKKREKLLPSGLILLSLIPVMAGMVRLTSLAGGTEVTEENARFFASPSPVILHIITSSIFCIIGAFQFAPEFRKRKPNWHRIAGRILIISGMVAAVSGLWMTQFYPLKPTLQGDLLYWIRIVVGSAMILFIIISFIAIRRAEVLMHKAWIIRAYAIGQGAGTQALILIPWVLALGKPDLFTYDLLMGTGWIINLSLAEWLIRSQETQKLPGFIWRGKFLKVRENANQG